MHRVTSREALKPLIARRWADELKGRELLVGVDERTLKVKKKRGRVCSGSDEEEGGMVKKGKGKERASSVGGFGFFDRPRRDWDEVEEKEEEPVEEETSEKEGGFEENVWENGVEVLMVAPWPGPGSGTGGKRTREETTKEKKPKSTKVMSKRRRIISPDVGDDEEDPFIDYSAPPPIPRSSTSSSSSSSSRKQRRSSLPNFRPSTSDVLTFPSSRTTSHSASNSNFRITSPTHPPPPKLSASDDLPVEPSPNSPLFPSRIPRPASTSTSTSTLSNPRTEDVKPTIASHQSTRKEIEEIFGSGAPRLAMVEKTFLDSPTLMGSIERTVAILQLRRGTESWGKEGAKEEGEGNAIGESLGFLPSSHSLSFAFA